MNKTSIFLIFTHDNPRYNLKSNSCTNSNTVSETTGRPLLLISSCPSRLPARCNIYPHGVRGALGAAPHGMREPERTPAGQPTADNYATVHSPDRRSPCTIYHVRATRPSFAFTRQLARCVGCGDGDGDGTGGMDAAEEGVVGATPLAGGLLALVPVGQISN